MQSVYAEGNSHHGELEEMLIQLLMFLTNTADAEWRGNALSDTTN